MIELDYKVTVWRRASVDTSKVDKNTLELFKSTISSGKDIDEIYEILGDYISTDVYMEDTEELLTVEDNQNNSTIELFLDEKIIITN